MKRFLLLIALVLSMFSYAQSTNKTMTNGGGTPGSGSTTATGGSTEVGVTNGELSVSLSGVANYNLQIAVPPGINGVVPQIGLNYSSQLGAGLLGYGWNISGLSSISRIPSTKFHDGVNDPVDLDALDRFALDGQRLMLKSGSYGIVGSTYETETYSNVKISLLANGAVEYFKVEYPDGSTAFYGFSTDSKVGLLTYNITYWENPQTVRITYYYTQTNNFAYISSIKYGAIGSNTPINEVQFIYKNRTRNEEYYVAGIGIINDKVLSQINVKGNGIGYRNYVLNHDIFLNYNRLISITEKNGDNTKSYNPTLFYYGDLCSPNQTEFITETNNTNNIELPQIRTISGDFNGDGKQEFFNETLPLKLKRIGINYSVEELSTFNDYTNALGTRMYAVNTLNSDFKLESKNSLCVIEFPSLANLNNYKAKIFKVDSNNVISFDYEKTIPSDNYNNNYGDTYIGDFNGDKLTDIVFLNQKVINNIAVTNFEFINLDRRETSNYISDTIINELGLFYTGDIDGDGKTDIFKCNSNVIKVYSLNENNVFEEKINFLTGSSTVPYPTYKGFILSDYNGDGKTDVLDLNNGRLFISNGISFTMEAIPNDFGIPLDMDNIDKVQFLSVDYNQDGKMDFIKVNPFKIQGNLVNSYTFYEPSAGIWITQSTYNYTHGINMTLYEKVGNGLWNIRYFSKEIEINTNPYDYIYNIFLFDKSKTNSCKTELAFRRGSYNLFFVSLDYDLIQIQNLKKITTGNGVSETITYSNLTDGNGVYTSAGQIENFPNVDILNSFGTSVVSQIEKTSSTVYKKQLYKYYGATSNIEGLGFLGFRSILKTNWFNDSSQIISNVTNYDITLRGAPSESYTVLGLAPLNTPFDSSNPFVSWTQNFYNYNPVTDGMDNPLLSNKVFKLRNTSTQVSDGLLKGNIVAINTGFDSYNNPISKTTTISNDLSIESITTVESLSYDNLPTATPYFIGRAKSKKITKSIQPSNDISMDEELYTYDKNLITQIQKRATNSGVTTDYVTEINAYDVYGNIITKTLKATNEIDRVYSFQYDTGTHRFLTRKIDTQLQATDYTYNLSTGLLLTESPPFTVGSPLTTTYTYDTWGKKISAKNYLNKIETYSYAITTDGVVKTTTGPSGENSSSKLILDDLGRINHEGTKTIDGKWSYTSTYYDINDKPILVSQPYFLGVEGLGTFDVWNEMQYDVYGRLIQSNSLSSNDSAGKQTVYSYTGLAVTENDGQKAKVNTKNPYDKIVSLMEAPTGTTQYTTINYEYFANGNLKKTSTSGADIIVEQDGWGRKKTLVDPSAGTYKYIYNNFGETKSEEVVGKGTTTYTLDDYGRVTTKTIAGVFDSSITTYTYDGTSKIIKGMSFTDTTNNYTVDYIYGYDNYRRLNNSTETRANYYMFQKDYTFDAYGRLDTEHFKAQDIGTNMISEKYIKTKYQNGYKYQLYDMTSNTVVGTTKLWQTTTVNQQGKVLTGTMGNGIAVTNTYDVYGFPTQIKHNKGTTNIMTLNTVFDNVYGNLTSRTNNLFGTWNETLSYDNLDRLTSYLDVNGIQTQSYNSNGTIATNNIGDYAYTISGKPFTLSTITPVIPSAVYDYYNAREQNITYNLFKSPISITEATKENIDFEYNAQNGRSVMYYGDQATTKSTRMMRKFYSADGSMEIKRNITNNVNDFVTYIGGDGYTAPVILKSDGTTKNYFYLHRDYQGSILAITNSTGVVVEKRLFGVWGSLIKYANNSGGITVPTTTTGLFLDRGYTGHEHLLGVGLINMNGRIYDDKLHRFLQPDNNVQAPYNTQNYNRYGYGMNNPTKYTDPSGEFWGFVIGFLVSTYVHGAQATGNANPLQWNAGQWANAAMAPASSLASSGISDSFNKYVNNYEANKRVLHDYNITGVEKSHPYVVTEDVHADPNQFSKNGNEMNSSSPKWYDYVGKKNFWISSFSTFLEKGTGITRFGTNVKLYHETVNGAVFYGNKFVETFGLAKAGKILGKASFGLGLTADAIGVSIFYKNPNSVNAVHPAKFVTNTGFGAIGLWGDNPFAAALYFGVDLFYPGGWVGNKTNPGLIMDQDRIYQENKAINPEWQMFPGAMKQ